MNKKGIFFFIFLSFFLFNSCLKDENVTEVESEKKDFYVDTVYFENFSSNVDIIKSGKIVSSQDINVLSQASGKVTYIGAKNGDRVKAGAVIVKLADTVGSYNSNLSKAKTGLDLAKLNYDTSIINLDKQINDAELAYKKSQSDYENAKKDIEYSLTQAQDSINSSSVQSDNSTSQLDLQKAQKELEKAEFDFSNLQNSNSQTKEGYNTSLKNFILSLYKISDEITISSDKILGVSKDYETYNDSFDNYLGVRNTTLKQQTKDDLLVLISSKEDLEKLKNLTISEENLLTKLLETYDFYLELDGFINEMKDVLDMSVISDNLSQTSIDSYLAQYSTYQVSVQSYLTQLSSLKIEAESFYATYKDLEESTLKSIDIIKQQITILEKQIAVSEKNLESANLNAKVSYTKTEIAGNNTLIALETVLDNSKSNLNNLLETKTNTISSLQNAIDQAQLSYNDALKEISKLTIKSPISGKIGKISADEGQEVGIGTVLFNVVSDESKQEINIGFNQNELAFISLFQRVKIKYKDDYLAGKIISIGSIADTNLQYEVKVALEKGLDITGEIVDVLFSKEEKNDEENSDDRIFIPLNIVNITDENKGFLYSLSGSEIEKNIVDLGIVMGDKIELKTPLESSLEIITSDVENYNENKFNLKIREG